MPGKKKSSKKSGKKDSNTTTTILSITSPTIIDDKKPIPTICINVNEQNNNSVDYPTATKPGVLQCLPEIFTDIEVGSRNAINHSLNDTCITGDLYKPYIFGKFSLFSFSFQTPPEFSIHLSVYLHSHRFEIECGFFISIYRWKNSRYKIFSIIKIPKLKPKNWNSFLELIHVTLSHVMLSKKQVCVFEKIQK